MFASWFHDAELLLRWLSHAAWQAGLLAAAVLTLTWLLGRRLRPRWRFALWLIVFARLALPVLPEASWSIFRILPTAGASQAADVALSSALPHRTADGQTNLPPDDSRDAGFVAPKTPQNFHEPALSPPGHIWLPIQFAVLIWIAGVFVLSLRRIADFVQLHRLERRWREITDPNDLSLLRQCSRELGISRSVPLYATPDNLGPATCGVVRPRIVLPQTLLDRLSPAELRFVLLHELVHVRRHDVLVDQLTGFVTIVHWFHPVAWISRYFLRNELEMACDAAVLERSSQANAAEYGHVILKTIESLAAPVAPLPGLVGMFSRRPPSQIHRRIESIVAHRGSTWPSRLLGGMLLFALVLVGLTDAQSRRPQTGPDPEPATSSPAVPAAEINTPKNNPEPPTVNGRTVRQYPLTVTGKAVDQNGRPVAGATILLVSTNNSPGKVLGKTTTNQDGRYEFRNAELPYYLPIKENNDYEQGTFQVFGMASGSGFTWQGMRFLFIDPRFRDASGKSTVMSPSHGYFPGEPIDLDLTFPPAWPIRGRFVDDQGQPIPGVKVTLTNCDYLDTVGKVPNQSYRELRYAAQQIGQAMPDQLKCVSDADGRFELKSVPEGIVCRLAMAHPEFGNWVICTATSDSPPKDFDGTEIRRRPIEMTREKTRSVSVHLHYADTREPAVGALVGAYLQIGTNNAWGESDKQGKVTLKLPPGEYTVWSNPPNGADYLKVESKLIVNPADEKQSVELIFERACVLVLRALDAATGAGVEDVTFWYEMESQPGKTWSVQSNDTTNDFPVSDAKGELRAIVRPGTRRYGIGFNPLPDNYRADNDDKTVGRELTLPAGQTVTAEFLLRK